MRDKVLKELVELLESEVRANNSYYEKKLTDRKSLYMSLQTGIDEDIMTGIPYERIILEFVEVCENGDVICDNISDYLFDKLEEIIEDINEENRIDAKDCIEEMDYLWNNSYKW